MESFVNGSKASCVTSLSDKKSYAWYFVMSTWLLCSQSHLSKDIYLLNYQSKVISISWRYCAQASLARLPTAQNQMEVMMQAYLHVISVPMQWSWIIAVDHAITTYRCNLPKASIRCNKFRSHFEVLARVHLVVTIFVQIFLNFSSGGDYVTSCGHKEYNLTLTLTSGYSSTSRARNKK